MSTVLPDLGLPELGPPERATVRGTRLAFWHLGRGGVPLLLVHGWPSTRRIWARNVATGEEKYFLSNAPADAKLQTLLRVAFCRWNVEHAFRVGKSELGFTQSRIGELRETGCV